MRIIRLIALFSLAAAAFCSSPFPSHADALNVARGQPGATGEWTTDTNNWQGAADEPLTSPGFPGANHSVGISGGTVSIESQDASVAELYMIVKKVKKGSVIEYCHCHSLKKGSVIEKGVSH